MKHMHLDIEKLEQRIAPGLIGSIGVVVGGGAGTGAAASADGGASNASNGTQSHGSGSHGSKDSHSS